MATASSPIFNATSAKSNYSMTNSNAFHYNAKVEWIVSMTFTFIATAFICYIIVALCYYGYKTKLMLGCGRSCWAIRNRSTSIINSFILFAACCALVYIAAEIPLVVSQVHPFCAVYQRIIITAYGTTILIVYVTLWYRVYAAFYANPVLKRNTNKMLQVINYSIVVLLPIGVCANLVLFYLSPSFVTSPVGCIAVQSVSAGSTRWIVLTSLTACFQLILLFVFIYPLYMHRQRMLDRGFDAKSTMAVVKRAAIVASVCVVSDFLNSGFGLAYDSPTVYINHVVNSCNIIVNLMATIFAFATWREKLFPFNRATFRVPVKEIAKESRTTDSTAFKQKPAIFSISSVV